MENEPEEAPDQPAHRSLKEKISGFGQKVLGEIESVGGALTGDPMTEAEGQFNIEVGDIREELADAAKEEAEKDNGR
jgi:uncharacterized protein YjbJ (UPF0337 family)